jgi:hypothetical protein
MMAGMAAKERSGAQPRIGSADFNRSCCKMVPGTPATMSTPPPQQMSQELMIVGGTLAGYVPNMTPRTAEDRTPPDRQLHSRSQSLLCTFLI